MPDARVAPAEVWAEIEAAVGEEAARYQEALLERLDGSSTAVTFTVNYTGQFEEGKHPRYPEGSSEGGRFAPKGTASPAGGQRPRSDDPAIEAVLATRPPATEPMVPGSMWDAYVERLKGAVGAAGIPGSGGINLVEDAGIQQDPKWFPTRVQILEELAAEPSAARGWLARVHLVEPSTPLGEISVGGRTFKEDGHYSTTGREVVGHPSVRTLSHEFGHNIFHAVLDEAQIGMNQALERVTRGEQGLWQQPSDLGALLTVGEQIYEPHSARERLWNAVRDFENVLGTSGDMAPTAYARSWAAENIWDETRIPRWTKALELDHPPPRLTTPRWKNQSFAELWAWWRAKQRWAGYPKAEAGALRAIPIDKNPSSPQVRDAFAAVVRTLRAVGAEDRAKTAKHTATFAVAWDEAEHPRQPEGSEGGGQFAPKVGGGHNTIRLRRLEADVVEEQRRLDRVKADFPGRRRQRDRLERSAQEHWLAKAQARRDAARSGLPIEGGTEEQRQLTGAAFDTVAARYPRIAGRINRVILRDIPDLSHAKFRAEGRDWWLEVNPALVRDRETLQQAIAHELTHAGGLLSGHRLADVEEEARARARGERWRKMAVVWVDDFAVARTVRHFYGLDGEPVDDPADATACIEVRVDAEGRSLGETIYRAVPMDSAATFAVAWDETYQAHSFGTVQIDLPPDLADAVRALAAEIPDEDLMANGRETRPHITIRYGVLPDQTEYAGDFEESKHPRWPTGSRRGGKFAPKSKDSSKMIEGAFPNGEPFIFGHESDSRVKPPPGPLPEISTIVDPKTGQIGFTTFIETHEELFDAVNVSAELRDHFARVRITDLGTSDQRTSIIPPYTTDPLEERRLVAAVFHILRQKDIKPDSGELDVEWATVINKERFGKSGSFPYIRLAAWQIQTRHMSQAEYVVAYLRTVKPFTVTLGTTGTFPPSKKSDNAAVVWVAAEAPELGWLHEGLGHTGAFRPGDWEYQPHVTVAYVRPGTEGQWAGRKDLAGQTFRVEAVTVADPAGKEMVVPLLEGVDAGFTFAWSLGLNSQGAGSNG